MKVVLINPYEIGRQPFGLAEPTALLQDIECEVDCLDLSIQMLEPDVLRGADLIGIYVAMHTATRIAVEALPRIRSISPQAHICVYGLYAPMNESLFRGLGVGTVLGGEFEGGLLSVVRRIRAGEEGGIQTEALIDLSKVAFVVPDRSKLPELSEYAHLEMPDNSSRIVGFVEASRGCKHVCRHCPVVPVYEGRFSVIPREVILADARNQISAGAQHLSFGDPDFLNGPIHAIKVVQEIHEEFPHITYDATIKIEHLLKHRELLPILKETGCIFVTSAVESVDDRILELLDKNHTNSDFGEAVRLLQEVGIDLSPTFLPFTPWTTLAGYVALLERLVDLNLANNISPIQLVIRLLVPAGSYLFKLPGFDDIVMPFDADRLGYPWVHEDPCVDQLQETLEAFVAEADQNDLARRETFAEIWALAHKALGAKARPLSADFMGPAVPQMSEPWYCCAEPTNRQLNDF
jgi:radical SAM superfamily enzyme YgiQ (UPF0313 family)